MQKKKILMAVYNPIEVDGRVKRAGQALGKEFELTLLCVRHLTKTEYRNPVYSIRRVNTGKMPGRILKLLFFWIQLLRYALMIRPAIIYVHDFFLPFPGYLVAKIVGAKIVYDAHELIIPDVGEVLTGNAALFYKLEKRVIKKIDLVIAANPERINMMVRHYLLKNMPVSVGNIPPKPVPVLDDAAALAKYPLLRRTHTSDIHVVYMGDMSFERGLRTLVDAGDFLPDNYRLFFVGRGPDLEILRSLAAEKKAGRLNIIGEVPHDEVHDAIRQADIGYLSYSMAGLNNILCAPNKIFEYSQAGLPVVSTCQPTVRNMFAKYPIGKLVGCEGEVVRPEMVAAAICEVADNKNMYAANIGPFLKNHAWESEAEKLVNAVKQLN